MKTILTIFTILISQWPGTTFAQNEEAPLVELIRDSRLDELTKRQYELNKNANYISELSKYKTSGGKYKGYRLMVLNTNNRDLAYQTRGQLATLFPQHALYLGYQAHYYKLKMGDFLEKVDAENLKRQLAGVIKQGIFIVSDAITLKPEEEERLIEKLSKEDTQ